MDTLSTHVNALSPQPLPLLLLLPVLHPLSRQKTLRAVRRARVRARAAVVRAGPVRQQYMDNSARDLAVSYTHLRAHELALI
eukprot:1299965-Alexandrium_andersonii.AAC.1